MATAMVMVTAKVTGKANTAAGPQTSFRFGAGARCSEATLKDLFPEFKEHLRNYVPTQDMAASRQKLEELLKRYGVE